MALKRRKAKAPRKKIPKSVARQATTVDKKDYKTWTARELFKVGRERGYDVKGLSNKKDALLKVFNAEAAKKNTNSEGQAAQGKGNAGGEDSSEESGVMDYNQRSSTIAKLRQECEKRGLSTTGFKLKRQYVAILEEDDKKKKTNDDSPDSEGDDSKYDKMSQKELQSECKKRGLPASGRKVDMAARLEADDQKKANGSSPTPDRSKYGKLSYKQLHSECKKRGLPANGRKVAMAARLEANDQKKANGSSPTPTGSKYGKLSYRQLQSECKTRELPANLKSVKLVASIEKYDKLQKKDVGNPPPSPPKSDPPQPPPQDDPPQPPPEDNLPSSQPGSPLNQGGKHNLPEESESERPSPSKKKKTEYRDIRREMQIFRAYQEHRIREEESKTPLFHGPGHEGTIATALNTASELRYVGYQQVKDDLLEIGTNLQEQVKVAHHPVVWYIVHQMYGFNEEQHRIPMVNEEEVQPNLWYGHDLTIRQMNQALKALEAFTNEEWEYHMMDGDDDDESSDSEESTGSDSSSQSNTTSSSGQPSNSHPHAALQIGNGTGSSSQPNTNAQNGNASTSRLTGTHNGLTSSSNPPQPSSRTSSYAFQQGLDWLESMPLPSIKERIAGDETLTPGELLNSEKLKELWWKNSLSSELKTFLKQKSVGLDRKKDAADSDTEAIKTPEISRAATSSTRLFRPWSSAVREAPSGTQDLSDLDPPSRAKAQYLISLIQDQEARIRGQETPFPSIVQPQPQSSLLDPRTTADEDSDSSFQQAQSRIRRSSAPSPEPLLWHKSANLHRRTAQGIPSDLQRELVRLLEEEQRIIQEAIAQYELACNSQPQDEDGLIETIKWQIRNKDQRRGMLEMVSQIIADPEAFLAAIDEIE
ncbi:hypothetical protein BT63DRAFT_417634 [Microthyrium microscopicum]|uniref:SAP domain-containing protein n=1 Tax=Microthyrium microscopicum TaxID=703497 RepID=A0A6A6U0B8_9PEZI|nr:hypothetical protein BT63DRAFT_417634 [Microthyrium microscopicum]